MKRFFLITALCFMMPFAASAQMKSQFGNALVDAADQGIEALVSAQIRNGNTVNVRGNFGVTPLMRASYHGYTNIMEILINLGANVDMADEGGATALHLAARQGNTEAVKLLLKYDATVDIADSEGWTPLMRAVTGQKHDVSELLLKAGANSEAKNEWGETALKFAQKMPGNDSLIAMMKQSAAAHRRQLTAVEAVQKNISVPVEQVLPRDLPVASNSIVMPAPKAPLPDDIETALLAPEDNSENEMLRQQLEAEKMARIQAELQLRAAMAGRQQQEADALSLAQAEVKRKEAERQRAEAQVLQAQAEARIQAEKQAAAEAEKKAALLAREAELAKAQAEAHLEAQKQAILEAEKKAAIAREKAKRAEEAQRLAQQQEAERLRQKEAMELALQQEQLARQASEEKLRAEIAWQQENKKLEEELAAIEPAAPPSLPTSENVLIGEAIAVPVSSNPLVVAATNPNPSLLKMNRGVWLQVGPFIQEREALAYYDSAIQKMTDLLPSRMKVITAGFLSEKSPQNFLRMGPYRSQTLAELACNAFRYSDLLCEYVREEASERYNSPRSL